uniref:Uncharacterized protein n=1 Tax=Sphaerodactylus townsendi TaxID=933632 RepID=A0ACB8FWC9_9SAUR
MRWQQPSQEFFAPKKLPLYGSFSVPNPCLRSRAEDSRPKFRGKGRGHLGTWWARPQSSGSCGTPRVDGTDGPLPSHPSCPERQAAPANVSSPVQFNTADPEGTALLRSSGGEPIPRAHSASRTPWGSRLPPSSATARDPLWLPLLLQISSGSYFDRQLLDRPPLCSTAPK